MRRAKVGRRRPKNLSKATWASLARLRKSAKRRVRNPANGRYRIRIRHWDDFDDEMFWRAVDMHRRERAEMEGLA